jgi:hypothetical protein
VELLCQWITIIATISTEVTVNGFSSDMNFEDREARHGDLGKINEAQYRLVTSRRNVTH